MASAALSESERQATAPAPDIYARSVWGALAAGAFTAALVAWLVAMVPPLRASLLIEHSGAAIGLTLLGVSVAASPLIVWASARLLARGPNLLNPVWLWLYAIALGAGANALSLLFMRESAGSVFVLVALGFAAVSVAHRIWLQLPAWICAALFAATGAGGEFVINAVLKETWPSTALDLGALGVVTLMILLRASGFERIRAMLKRPHPKAGVSYAAMHLIGLAEAPAAKAARDTSSVHASEEEARS